MRMVLLVVLAIPIGAALLLAVAFGVTTFHAERASDGLCAWFATESATLPESLPDVGPQTRGTLNDLRNECRACTCGVTRGPHAESLIERAIVVSRNGQNVLGLRVTLTQRFTPVILGFWTEKSTK